MSHVAHLISHSHDQLHDQTVFTKFAGQINVVAANARMHAVHAWPELDVILNRKILKCAIKNLIKIQVQREISPCGFDVCTEFVLEANQMCFANYIEAFD